MKLNWKSYAHWKFNFRSTGRNTHPNKLTGGHRSFFKKSFQSNTRPRSDKIWFVNLKLVKLQCFYQLHPYQRYARPVNPEQDSLIEIKLLIEQWIEVSFILSTIWNIPDSIQFPLH